MESRQHNYPYFLFDHRPQNDLFDNFFLKNTPLFERLFVFSDISKNFNKSCIKTYNSVMSMAPLTFQKQNPPLFRFKTLIFMKIWNALMNESLPYKSQIPLPVSIH